MKKNYGITLISLVITIVVILIIATVSVTFLNSENGGFLIGKSKDAAEEYNEMAREEQEEIQSQTPCALTFDGTGGNSSQSQIIVLYREIITLPTAKRYGYLFLGWCQDRNGIGQVIEAGTQVAVMGTGTMYAIWQYNLVTITFNPNGGSVTPESVLLEKGTEPVVFPTAFKEGARFLGWSGSPTDTTASWPAGTICGIWGDVTVYAIYENIQ